MNLRQYNPKKPPTSEDTKKTFVVNKFNDVVLPLIVAKIKKDAKLLEENNPDNINKHPLTTLDNAQIKAIVDIYFRDIAAYLHTPNAPRYSLPIGPINIRYGAIDSYIKRKILPHLKLAKINQDTDRINSIVNKFKYLWGLRNTKRGKHKSTVGIDNAALQLSVKDNIVLRLQETNPIQITVIELIKKLIKNDTKV